MTTLSSDDQKRAVGEAAAAMVESGMIVGLGTGSTAACFVVSLAARKLDLRCVATSEATAALAVKHGLTVVDLDDAGEIDLTIDGADEIGPQLTLIKGGGAALLREKLVWEASKRCVAIADAGKRTPKFGQFPLPIEVVAFGHGGTATRLVAALEGCGVSAPPVLREKAGAVVRTDSGNVIYDVACGEIVDAAGLGAAVKAVTGVVEHGLFIGLTEVALLGTDQGVLALHP
jgi:ribose 5-phosphate isomerase A